MDCFFERYLMEPSKYSTTDIAKWEGTIRLRLINVIKIWVSKHFCLFDKNSLEKLCSYIEGLVIPRQPEWGRKLQDEIGDKIAQHENGYVTIGDVPISMDLLADYILRISTKMFPKVLGTSLLKREFTKSELQLICESIEGTNSKEAAANLQRLILAGKFSSIAQQRYIFTSPEQPPPKPLIISKLKYVQPTDILNIHPKEFARQLTLIEFDLFCNIEPSRDLINVSKVKSDTVRNCIQFSNTLSKWVAGEIVKTVNSKKRVAVVRRFIEIAEEMWNLNNFNSAAAILFGIDHRAVQRLQLTWKSIPKRELRKFQEFLELISVKDNFEKLRAAQDQAIPPLIPYLAIYLKDIALLELGNPTIVSGTTDVLNFAKFTMIARHFFAIQELKKVRYNFRWCSILARWLQKISPVSEDELFYFSDLCEERVKTVDVPVSSTPRNSLPSLPQFIRRSGNKI